jgi:hypothetical protein
MVTRIVVKPLVGLEIEEADYAVVAVGKTNSAASGH